MSYLYFTFEIIVILMSASILRNEISVTVSLIYFDFTGVIRFRKPVINYNSFESDTTQQYQKNSNLMINMDNAI